MSLFTPKHELYSQASGLRFCTDYRVDPRAALIALTSLHSGRLSEVAHPPPNTLAILQALTAVTSQAFLALTLPSKAKFLLCPRSSLVHDDSPWVRHWSVSGLASASGALPSSNSSVRRASVGVLLPCEECGLTLLSSSRQSASLQRASARLSNISSLRHSSIARQAMRASPRGAQAAVERLDVAILLRAFRGRCNATRRRFVGPLQDRLAAELGPIACWE